MRSILVHTCITPEEDEAQVIPLGCGCVRHISRPEAGRLVASGSAQWRQWRSRISGKLVDDFRAVVVSSPRAWKPVPSGPGGPTVLQLIPVGS